MGHGSREGGGTYDGVASRDDGVRVSGEGDPLREDHLPSLTVRLLHLHLRDLLLARVLLEFTGRFG